MRQELGAEDQTDAGERQHLDSPHKINNDLFSFEVGMDAFNNITISAKIQANWNNESMDWGGVGDRTMDVAGRGGMERQMKGKDQQHARTKMNGDGRNVDERDQHTKLHAIQLLNVTTATYDNLREQTNKTKTSYMWRNST